MAHYKRGKCRFHGKRKSTWKATQRRWNKYLGHPVDEDGHLVGFGRYLWLSSEPAWWHIIHHSRPRRRHNRRLEKKVMQGHDLDNMVWPLGNHKPHKYYW